MLRTFSEKDLFNPSFCGGDSAILSSASFIFCSGEREAKKLPLFFRLLLDLVDLSPLTVDVRDTPDAFESVVECDAFSIPVVYLQKEAIARKQYFAGVVNANNTGSTWAVSSQAENKRKGRVSHDG